MMLYAKWIGGDSPAVATAAPTTEATAAATLKPTSSSGGQTPTAAATPVATTAQSGAPPPSMTQAPAPLLGGLFGLPQQVQYLDEENNPPQIFLPAHADTGGTGHLHRSLNRA